MVGAIATAEPDERGLESARIVEIGTGALRATIAPEIGGALARLVYDIGGGRWFDLLRPATTEALAARNPREMACFPMVPFASFVHQGRFSFLNEVHQLRLNIPQRNAALHGDGWQNPWTLTHHEPQRAALAYRHDGSGFPFPYSAQLEIAIEGGDDVRLVLEVRNTGAKPMPAGIGFHPFFARTDDVTLQFEASTVWNRDPDGRVLDQRPCAPADSFERPKQVGNQLRNDVYEGWRHQAGISWPSAGVHAQLVSAAPLSRLLLFVPQDRPVFCVEPISNLPDGFNLLTGGAPDTGVQILAPGQTLRGAMKIVVRTLDLYTHR